jgi:hypothetical protein
VHDTRDDGEHPSSGDPDSIADPYVLGPLRGAVPQPPAPPRRYRSTLVTAALGLALVVSWGTGIGLLVQRVFWAPTDPVAAVAGGPRRASLPPSPARASIPGAAVPRATTTIERGAITVVDVGVGASSLADELARQRAAARDAHETMVVMTTILDSPTSASLFEALSDPRMQAALARVRLVRVDIKVFVEDLDSLDIPRVGYPSFFVLGPDLRPRDGIDADEWDENIPENMAPVLSAFVRGTLTKRRTPWQARSGAGMRL